MDMKKRFAALVSATAIGMALAAVTAAPADARGPGEGEPMGEGAARTATEPAVLSR
jgi:hypothetical protein